MAGLELLPRLLPGKIKTYSYPWLVVFPMNGISGTSSGGSGDSSCHENLSLPLQIKIYNKIKKSYKKDCGAVASISSIVRIGSAISGVLSLTCINETL